MGRKVTFTLRGHLQPKQRPRRVSRGGTFFWITPQETLACEKRIADEARLAMLRREPFTGYIALHINVIEAVAPSWTVKKKQAALAGDILPTGCDWDNQAKTIGDALNGIVYTDDRQIVFAQFMRSYGEADAAVISVMEIADATAFISQQRELGFNNA